ncbi:MAG: hypothetical protein K2X35_22695 [Bryobacteraceae bacterium]|nr:hypothetical protein [Bryobacteraceae bacterium]
MKKVLSIALILASGAFALTIVEQPKGCSGNAAQHRQTTTMDWARGVLYRMRAAWQLEVRKPRFTGADAHQRHTPLSLAEFARQAEVSEASEVPPKKL